MWIARDKDGCLWLFEDKPIRGKDEWMCDYTCDNSGSAEIDILNSAIFPFPEVTWENSPKELIIKTEENDGEMIRTDKEFVEEVYDKSQRKPTNFSRGSMSI